MMRKRGFVKWIFLIASIFPIIFDSAIHAENLAIDDYTGKCGGEYSGYRYTISSPNYPGPYANKQNCIYTLRGSDLAKCEQMFHLQFLDFSLPPSENCNEDYVEIGDRSLYCGRVAGVRNFSGKNNKLVVRFHSGTRRAERGFKILVTTLPCSGEKFDEKNRAESTNDRETTFINGKIGKSEISNPLDNLYPIYRPEVDFSFEDNGKFVKGDVSSPPKVDSLDDNDNNVSLKIHENPVHKIVDYPSTNLEIPVHESQLFRDTSTYASIEIVTPTSIDSNVRKPLKLSTYLFLPPVSSIKSTPNATPPSTDFSLPIRWNAPFRKTEATDFSTQQHENLQKINEKFVVPAKSYGVPNEPYYPSFRPTDHDLKTGEVLENPRNIADCQGPINLEPDLEVTADFHGNGPETDGEYRSSFVPATIYGSPVTTYPSDIRNGNVDITLGAKFPPSVVNQQIPNFPGINRPNQWSPGTNFVPSNFYPGIQNPGTIGRSSECCSNAYSAQRFLLSSPGFPSLFYNDDRYDCYYTIIPHSIDTCQIRFNFKFFNHGTDDRLCENGHLQIDGRSFCGCKKGLSIVSPVRANDRKTIGVRYSGYPRTKFNGFMIEVIQESCGNGYPYLSRNKKEIGNSSLESQDPVLENNSGIVNVTQQRMKRNLGYSYPKPSFGLNEDSHSWNSENTINSHQFSNQGAISGNIFSPLLTCQALSLFDWTIAAKEVYLRNGRCIRGNTLPGQNFQSYNPSGQWNPGYPNGAGPGISIYPGNALPGTFSIYPGNAAPGTASIYPGNTVPGTASIYPGNAVPGTGSIYPGNAVPGTGSIYPGNAVPGTGSIYPGNAVLGTGSIYPGNAVPGTGSIYPGNAVPGTGSIYSGNAVPGTGSIYPGNAVPGTGSIYPGNAVPGTITQGYPANVGPGTILPVYPSSGNGNFPSIKCEDINVAEGIISSPQSPNGYPVNVRKCFRFYKAPDACQLELAILDFDLENSVRCSKDYVAFSGVNRRYCGRSLAGSKVLFDISRGNVIEVYFVSDGFGSGRGFSAGFSQIPCRAPINR